MPNYDSRVAGLRAYFTQCDAPGSCQIVHDRIRTDYDADGAVVILRGDAGKVLATYAIRDLESIAEWDGDTHE